MEGIIVKKALLAVLILSLSFNAMLFGGCGNNSDRPQDQSKTSSFEVTEITTQEEHVSRLSGAVKLRDRKSADNPVKKCEITIEKGDANDPINGEVQGF